MTTRTAVGPLRRSLAGARAVGAAPTYTTTGDTTPAQSDGDTDAAANELIDMDTAIQTAIDRTHNTASFEIDLAPEERLPRLNVYHQFWRNGHDENSTGALYAGVQAGGSSPGSRRSVALLGWEGSGRFSAID